MILVGGDKARNWRGWYRTAVPLAETAYADHLARIAKHHEGHDDERPPGRP